MGLGGGEQGRNEGWVEEVQEGRRQKEPNEENTEPNQNTKTCVQVKMMEEQEERAGRGGRCDGETERREGENEFQRVGRERKIADEASAKSDEKGACVCLRGRTHDRLQCDRRGK